MFATHCILHTRFFVPRRIAIATTLGKNVCGSRSRSPALLFLYLALTLTGCASTRPGNHQAMFPGHTSFEKVGIVDFRSDTLEDYQKLVRPGDLIVNYMRLGRAAKKEQWLFALLPHGHSMIVLDPYDARGILECRFHGNAPRWG